jgi:metal-responsive CopG/Arc/MetJ family transcriptional regulator
MKGSSAKKRGGRPATGKHPNVGVRLPQPISDQIDRVAVREKKPRGAVIRELVIEALAARRKS